jgi:hypothetical protein
MGRSQLGLLRQHMMMDECEVIVKGTQLGDSHCGQN